MSLPHLLLVDDSEAVLAFERAALSGHYALTTATNGREAMKKLAQSVPAAVLLDLSMPQMDGDEVLAEMQRDAALRRVPVIIISSERRRAEECLKKGAKAFLPKPIRAKELLPLVSRVLGEVRSEERRGNLAALFVGVGELEIGLPLSAIETVLHMMATRPLPGAADFLGQQIELHGQRMAVLDLGKRLSVAPRARLDERKLLVLMYQGTKVALCVDFVRDPLELLAADLGAADELAQSGPPALRELLQTSVATPRGQLAIIEPGKLLTEEQWASLPALLAAGAAA